MTPVFGLCDDYVTRWAALDPVAAGMQGLSGVFGAAADYSPDGYAARAELMTVTLAALAGTAWPCCRATATTRGGTSRPGWPRSRSCSPAGEPVWTPG